MKLLLIKAGSTFTIADTEFIVLEHLKNGTTICLTKDFIKCNAQFDENTNNYAKASIRKVYENFAKRIAAVVGDENMDEFELDLTTDDGLKDYGSIKTKCSPLTDVQYRKYSEIIEHYPVDDWWWLANAVSTPRRDIKYWVRCVTSGGNMYYCICGNSCCGVRAVCIFSSELELSWKKETKSGEMNKEYEIGDGTIIHAPEEVKADTLNFFDDLEYECWELFKQYAHALGIEIEGEGDADSIDFYIAKQIQETVLDIFEKDGVKIKYFKEG